MKLSNQPFFLKGANHEHACLLLHGLGGGIYEMQPLAEHLHQQGLTVQGINYPGHDKPSLKMPDSTWLQWYEHVLQTYQKLSQNYASISIVGFSTGCPLALYLAATNPVQKIILLSPFVAVKHEWYYLIRPEIYLNSVGHMLIDVPRFKLPIRDKAMRQAAEQVAFFRTFNLPSVRSALELINRVKPMLPQIDAPALIIQSPKDTVVAPAGAKFLYQKLGSRVKKLHWLQKSDHIISLDVEREEVFTQVSTFLLQPQPSSVFS